MLISLFLILLLLLLLINSLFRVSVVNKVWSTAGGYKVCCLMSARSNVFLIKANGLVIMVDTNLKRNQKKLARNIRKLKIDTIDYLILTHSHFDHAGNAAFVKNQYGAKVVIHKEEKHFLEQGLSPLPAGCIYVTRFIIRVAHYFNIKYPYPQCTADITIDDDWTIPGTNIRIIQSPGHTAGSISVAVDNEILLAGDSMFGVFSFSIFPPFADDFEQLKKTWKKLHLTGCKVFIPSHGSTKTHRDLLLGIKRRGTF